MPSKPAFTSANINRLDRNQQLCDPKTKGLVAVGAGDGKPTRWVFRYTSPDGRRTKYSFGTVDTHDMIKARQEAAKLRAMVENGGDPNEKRRAEEQAEQERCEAEARAITLHQLWDRYLAEHAHVHKKPSAVRTDQWLWDKYLQPRFGALKVKEIKRRDVAEWLAGMANTPTNGNRGYALLSKMFSLAVEWEIIEAHPALKLKKYRENKRERFLNADELARLADVLAKAEAEGQLATGRDGEGQEIMEPVSPVAVAAIRALVFTGCRKGEILNLRWSEVDIDGARLLLKDSKTGAKTVWLTPPAVDLLRSIPRRSTYVFQSPALAADKPLVNLDDSWQRVRSAAGLDDVRLHDLRHNFASEAAAAGLSLPVIGSLLGHRSSQTTARYAHLADAVQRAAAEEIGEALAAKMAGKIQEIVTATADDDRHMGGAGA